ncbi:hypothetical protein CI109_107159 [Kwoniella shandongensis]|uniref:Eukaryotic translation initiation factor 3 subunit M n=1 Tax=Kwoniella shandongensis TaxID=1734106 RepID=A0A5M6C2Y8_9TREE|nr:uncharacterized protein CI109_002442 [Kwoniella shandongensis]KAA5529101.1 hypothetical protein CI109_002442 [Kwoniella shandongensis]
MVDAISIAPELPFKQQVLELAAHLSRSIPNPDQTNIREFVASFEAQVQVEEGQEISEEKKKEVVKSIVGKFVELKGGLEAAKESEVESSHLLLQYLLSTSFDASSEDYSSAIKSVAEAVKKGAEGSNKAGRVEAGARILNNTYNLLPASSPLRPSVLLTLLSLLAGPSDLSSLPLTTQTLTIALAQWQLSSAEKVQFLSSASELFQSSGSLPRALDLLTLALKESVEAQLVEKAILVALAVQDKFELDDVLSVQGVKEQLSGKAAEVVSLFEGDEVEAVGKGQKWVAANGSWVESAGITGFTADSVLRKLRLIALVALAAKSETRQLEYAPIAKALSIDESEVETWVIDAIRSKLIVARISQPQSLIRIQSLSSSSTSARRFGSSEWQLLEKRLTEWKKSVSEARSVVEEAEALAAQGPVVQQQRRGGGNRRQQGQGQGQQQQQGQGGEGERQGQGQGQEEAVVA